MKNNVKFALSFLMFFALNVCWIEAAPAGNVSKAKTVGTLKMIYTNTADIFKDGQKAVGKIAEISNADLNLCTTKDFRFFIKIGNEYGAVVVINNTTNLYEKFKSFAQQKNLKIKFRISNVYKDAKNVIGQELYSIESLVPTQEQKTDSSSVFYTNASSIITDGANAVGKVAQISGAYFIDCSPDYFKFLIEKEDFKEIYFSDSQNVKSLYNKFNSFDGKRNLKIKFAIKSVGTNGKTIDGGELFSIEGE